MTQEQLDNKTDFIEMTESDIIEHCLKYTSSGLALNPIQVIKQIKNGEKWTFKGVLIKLIK